MKSQNKYDLQERLVKFSAGIILNIGMLKKNFATEHLTKQLIRSVTSAALNYGEAQGVESKKDFMHKMKLVLKELRITSQFTDFERSKFNKPKRTIHFH